MFNIYSYEKKLKEEEEEAKRKLKEKKIEEQRKKILPDLAENYQKRIKRFIFDMANKPIVIKESKHNFNTTRQEFMNDNNRKFGGSGKFSFRKYKTDKERVEEYLREKEQNEKQALKILRQKGNFSAEKEKLKNSTLSSSSVKQPIMRFKPRTDLERIYYSINSFSYGKVSKDAINEQLEQLDLFDKQKEKEENPETNFLAKYDNLDEKQIEELVSQKEFLNNQGYNEKNSETVKQITVILDYHSKKHMKGEDDPSLFNSKQAWKTHVNRKAAKKILGEYNQKTHFKAASVFSFNMDEFKTKNYHKSGNFNKTSNFKEAFGNWTNKENAAEAKKLQNKSTQDFYLNFNYYDEPGHSEDENNLYSNSNNDLINDINNKDNKYNTNRNFYKGKVDSGNRVYFNSNQRKKDSNFNKTSQDFGKVNDLLLKTYKNFKTNSHRDNVKTIPLDNFEFNPYDKQKQEFDYDPKILVYLKRLSQSNSVAEINEEMKNSNGKDQKNYGFLANLKKKTMNILAMKNDASNNFLKDISINEIEDMRKCEEEKIIIDNESYLKSQLDLISRKILKKCNFINNKSDFNNKNLKAGNGKLMITSGLTINDFIKKFNIPR